MLPKNAFEKNGCLCYSRIPIRLIKLRNFHCKYFSHFIRISNKNVSFRTQLVFFFRFCTQKIVPDSGCTVMIYVFTHNNKSPHILISKWTMSISQYIWNMQSGCVLFVLLLAYRFIAIWSGFVPSHTLTKKITRSDDANNGELYHNFCFFLLPHSLTVHFFIWTFCGKHKKKLHRMKY